MSTINLRAFFLFSTFASIEFKYKKPSPRYVSCSSNFFTIGLALVVYPAVLNKRNED